MMRPRLKRDLNAEAASRWALRRAEELGGCYAVRLGDKWFAVRGEELVVVQQHELLARAATNTHGVAP